MREEAGFGIVVDHCPFFRGQFHEIWRKGLHLGTAEAHLRHQLDFAPQLHIGYSVARPPPTKAGLGLHRWRLERLRQGLSRCLHVQHGKCHRGGCQKLCRYPVGEHDLISLSIINLGPFRRNTRDITANIVGRPHSGRSMLQPEDHPSQDQTASTSATPSGGRSRMISPRPLSVFNSGAANSADLRMASICSRVGYCGDPMARHAG